MKTISKNIIENPYIRTEKSSAVLLTLIDKVLNNINQQLKLKEKTYFHVLIKYPPFWPHDLDLFRFIDKKIISKIREKKCFFIFDASAEGFSPFEENWFEIFYHTCEIHNIDPYQIIFVSSNLKDEDNIKKYCKDKNKKPINVFTLPLFEKACQTEGNIDHLLNEYMLKTNKAFKDKYFSSLSRLNRRHRSVGTFLLCQSPVKNKALISHNILKKSNYDFIDIIKKTDYNEKHIKRWVKSLPLIVDYNNFNVNWAVGGFKYAHIHNQTIFQIVNETLVDNFNDSSLFYSEKTFRPISCFQPFLIYGQRGCNRYLKNLGYRTYDDWFDLSFDEEEDYIRRYQKLLLVVEDTCKYLDSLTREQQINWKFKNLDVLTHNVNTMNNQNYTFEKLEKFLLELENQIEAHSK